MPPLEPGDRLTRAEFERRYEAMPPGFKAELIEGIVYMASPVRQRQHGRPHAVMVGWLTNYFVATPGVEIADNSTVRLPGDNEPQPDALLFIPAEKGGQARVDEEGYVVGGPELIVEVASSSASYDLHAKKRVYRRHGVREYLVWRVLDREVDWFVLRGGRYERLPAGEDGVTRSEVFPGLWLDTAALVADDLQRVLAVLQAGIAAPEHAAFADQLRG